MSENIGQVPQTDLQRVVALAELLVQQQAVLAAAEAEVKRVAGIVFRLEREDLPAVMDEVGLRTIELASGKKVGIKADVDTGISKENRPKAFAWLLAHGFGGIIKTGVEVEFGKGEHTEAIAIAKKLQGLYKDRAVQVEETVHPSTLKAFVKERLAAGDPIPFDLFGIYQYTKAVITD